MIDNGVHVIFNGHCSTCGGKCTVKETECPFTFTDDWTDEQIAELFEGGETTTSNLDEVAARIADPAETGVHHVGWDSHAQRGTKPYDDSDTTGSTW